MNKTDIECSAIKIIEQELHTDLTNVDRFGILEDYKINLDSLKYIRIVVALEAEFDIQFDDEELNFGKIRTLNDIFNILNSHLTDSENNNISILKGEN